MTAAPSSSDPDAPRPEDAAAAPGPRKEAAEAPVEIEIEDPGELEEGADRPFDIDPDIVSALREALDEGERETILTLLEGLHAADIADLLEQIRPAQRRALIEAMADELDPEMLTELTDGVRDEVLGYIAPERLAEAVAELETDDVVYLVKDLAPDAQAEALSGLEAGERAAVQQSLAYPEYSAGRLMQRELVWAPPFKTVGEILDAMREEDPELPEHFYEILIVDPAFKPIGKVPLSRVIPAKREVALGDLMSEEFTVLSVDQPQEEVAYAFNQYHLVSAPVVDDNGRLVGVITIDDAMSALDEEAEEDLLRLGGVGDEGIGDKIKTIVFRRFPWLAVNLATAVLASMVIGAFDTVIEQQVALAVLMPIVASMGGNAGTQTLTVAVRALATRDLTSTNAFRIIARETIVGLLNGLAFAVVVGLVGYVWFGDWLLGGVLAMAMVINLLTAGLAGIVIPIWLDRVGADPALASGVFVTTVTDVVGFFAFLGIAALVLL